MDQTGSHSSSAIEPLCYGGESVVDVVTVAGGAVGVTTHRVIAHTPGEPGPTVSTVERPNVGSIDVDSAGDAGYGFRALRYCVYALALIGGSFLVNFDGMSAIDPQSAAGAGEVTRLAVSLTGLLAVVDDVLRIAGAVVLVGALAFAALYGYSRDRYLTIEVAGDDPLRVPLLGNEPVDVDRLAVAVEKASNPSDG